MSLGDTIGLTLKSLRLARGLSQAKAARRAGVSADQVQKWESGRNLNCLERIDPLSRLYQTSTNHTHSLLDAASRLPLWVLDGERGTDRLSDSEIAYIGRVAGVYLTLPERTVYKQAAWESRISPGEAVLGLAKKATERCRKAKHHPEVPWIGSRSRRQRKPKK